MRHLVHSLGSILACWLAAGCGPTSPGADVDARRSDASPPDAGNADAVAIDGSADATGLADAASGGFGTITGMCGVLGPDELTGVTPMWFQGDLDFGSDRYDDPADRDRLTPGGLEIILDGNAGGSSVYSEVFAYEWLARCEGATLYKSENEVLYDDPGSKRIDLVVDIDSVRVGVSVTRLVMYPFGNPYTLDAATTLLDRKLDDIQVATAHAITADHWDKQVLSLLAYDIQHAAVAMEAWQALDSVTRDDTLLVVTVTSGDDLFIYTDQ
jgi:hypothetical protein